MLLIKLKPRWNKEEKIDKIQNENETNINEIRQIQNEYWQILKEN